jgi:hypothetical protein
MPNQYTALPFPERFWSKVDKSGAIPTHHPDLGCCWEWIAARDWDGYGMFSIGIRDVRAHRVSWELHHGPIPAGKEVCHTCDNPSCVNPSHCFLGSTQENTADRVAKKRSAFGDRNGMRRHPEIVRKGESAAIVRLTAEQVREIRIEYAKGDTNTYILAERFGVNASTIQRIVLRRTWKHIP